MIEKFNKANARKFREDFKRVIAALEVLHGCNVSLGTLTIDGNELRGKMTARKGKPTVKATKADFSIGDIVTVNHHKVHPDAEFTVIKINPKTIQIQNNDTGALVKASPNLLIKKQ